MPEETFEIRVKGKPVRVPSVCLRDRRVISEGKWWKLGSVHDEEWLAEESVIDPRTFLAELKSTALKIDIFTFGQKIPDNQPRYSYKMEWDNAAAIPLQTFSGWWDKLPQVTRKNVRRSTKRGVTVREVPFDDSLVHAIVAIYNETLIKQGIPFAHHGKDFETVKKELSSMLDRSEFLGAFCDNEMIGFIKVVYMRGVAAILHIVSMDQHYDKRPANALITRLMELCEQKKITHVLYGKYSYGNKTNSPLAEFKHRMGFEELLFPRYFVPLTIKGNLVLRLGLHRGLIGSLPSWLIPFLIRTRAGFYRNVARLKAGSKAKTAPSVSTEAEANEAGAA
jgi:hypothetical protein